MRLPAPVAFLTNAREIRVIDRQGHTHEYTLAFDGPLMWGAWKLGTPHAAAFSWPTWSPDGRQVACFRLPSEETATARVFAHEVSGVSSVEMLDLGNRLPIYMHWSPDGQWLAILTQRKDRLQLSVVRPDRPGEELTLAEGSPLFFTWAGSDAIAAYIGDLGGATPRVAVLRPDGGRSIDLPGRPGSFCAPLWMQDRIVYVTVEGSHTVVVSALPESMHAMPVEDATGLVALIASPDGRTLARAVAPDGDGTPYRSLALVDLVTHVVRPLVDVPCLAFFWSPKGDCLVVAHVDTERNLLRWVRVDLDGTTTPLCDMYPTRDLGFYLRFFEQYVQSHPLVDPEGRYLLLAGTFEGAGGDTTPHVWRISLRDGAAESLGEGLFAVWGPATAPA